MSIIYAVLWIFCLCSFLVLLLEWIRLERYARERTRILQIHARKLKAREVF